MSGHANFHTIGGFTALHLPPSPQVESAERAKEPAP